MYYSAAANAQRAPLSRIVPAGDTAAAHACAPRKYRETGGIYCGEYNVSCLKRHFRNRRAHRASKSPSASSPMHSGPKRQLDALAGSAVRRAFIGIEYGVLATRSRINAQQRDSSMVSREAGSYRRKRARSLKYCVAVTYVGKMPAEGMRGANVIMAAAAPRRRRQ